MSATFMPWGKHRGKPLSEVPASYLWWVTEETDVSVNEPLLYFALVRELVRRLLARWPGFAPDFYPPSAAAAPASDSLSAAALRNCYRELSKRHHPDCGGSTAVMQVINEFYELLQEHSRGDADNGKPHSW